MNEGERKDVVVYMTPAIVKATPAEVGMVKDEKVSYKDLYEDKVQEVVDLHADLKILRTAQHTLGSALTSIAIGVREGVAWMGDGDGAILVTRELLDRADEHQITIGETIEHDLYIRLREKPKVGPDPVLEAV